MRQPSYRVVIRVPVSIAWLSRSVCTGLVFPALLLGAAAAEAADTDLPTHPQAPRLSCDIDSRDGKRISSEGVIDLKWQLRGAAQFELLAAAPDDPDRFQRRYLGADRSSVLSGLPEGLHRFKVRGLDAEGIPGAWSLPLEVEVSYMDASRVRLLMILGGLVVLITASAILHGHLTHRGKEAKR